MSEQFPPPPTRRHQAKGILAKKDIRELGLILIEDEQQVDERCFKHASYDLRLGSDYVLPSKDGDEGQTVIRQCKDSGFLTIQGFSSAIVSTYEEVQLPANIAGRFDLRIRHALEGLIVQMGTQVEPGYKGRLFALLHNVSENPKTLKYRDYETRPFTIEFATTTSATDVPPQRRTTINDFIPPNYAHGSLNRVIERQDTALAEQERIVSDLRELQRERNSWKQQISMGFLTVVIVGLVTALISGLVPWFLGRFTYEKYGFPIANSDTLLKMAGAPPTPPLTSEQIEKIVSTKLAENSSAVQPLIAAILAIETTRSSFSNSETEKLSQALQALESYKSSLPQEAQYAKQRESISSVIDNLRTFLNRGR